MIITVHETTKKRIKLIEAEIVRLNAILQASYETICEANGYAGEYKITNDFDIECNVESDIGSV